MHIESPPRWIDLPPELERAVEDALASIPAARWVRAAQELSLRYRAERHDDPQALATGRDQALGYAAMILPATYAQLGGALHAVATRIPGWQPRTLLDIGSGPGTALWAASAQWPAIESMSAWEREPSFITLGRELARSGSAAVRAAHWARVDLRRAWPDDRRYDLVILGHVLNELPSDEQARIVDEAWQRTTGLLLIVEPGTSAAFPVVRSARDRLLHHGAHTIAPCAHDAPCPLRDDWCHFPQRLTRPPFQRRARGAPSTWEDSKFSYAAMARFAADTPIWARVIRETTSNKAYAEAKLSTAAGISIVRGLKRHKPTYRQVQDLQWGAAIDQPLPEPVAEIPFERAELLTDQG